MISDIKNKKIPNVVVSIAAEMQFCAILCITIESHSNFFADFSGIAPVMLSAIQGSTDVEHSQAEKVQPSSQTHEPSFGKTNATIGAWNSN